MKKIVHVLLILLFIFCLNGFGQTGRPPLQNLHNEAGFITIEPVDVYFHFGDFLNRLSLTSASAKIWYSFHAADDSPEDKPLFVFFNGGPGSGTSSGLMSMNTGRFTLDNTIEGGGGDVFIDNPFSWTRMGNLLYIDARTAGFSYSLHDQASNEMVRFQQFNAQNYNPFFDGADFVRALLRFLTRFPSIQSNRVVIVGESYGGIRSTVMLHLLLNYTNYANGKEMYQDPALSSEIQAHYNRIFPQFADQTVPPSVITRQFGHQILIQPAITMRYQRELADALLRLPGSIIYDLGREIGIPYDPNVHDPDYFARYIAERDLYIISKPRDWLNAFFINAGRLLRTTNNLSRMTEVDATQIFSLYAQTRTSAYKIFDANYTYDVAAMSNHWLDDFHFLQPAQEEMRRTLQESGDMEAVFGRLQPWDRYFLGSNYNANWAFHYFSAAGARGYEVYYSQPRFGRMFLKNVAHVHTFITNAKYDLVVYANAIPPALAQHDTIISAAEHDRLPGEEDRPGRIVLHYQPGAFPDIPDLTTRSIRFPFYSKSCHAVSLTQPEDLFSDVRIWLIQNGLDVTEGNGEGYDH
ncbi:MAG: S10 family peptidase [Candidatus Aminicenantes bacterium]|nr:S10 family peptidase [Candidatus Aminicenantes bacterium]